MFDLVGFPIQIFNRSIYDFDNILFLLIVVKRGTDLNSQTINNNRLVSLLYYRVHVYLFIKDHRYYSLLNMEIRTFVN